MTTDDDAHEVDVVGRSPRRWVATFLLAVMLCTLLSTPLAIFYRSRSARSVEDASAVEDSQGAVNRIAYITHEHQLETMAPDGSDRRRLTDLNGRFQFPAWSPDGTLLAVLGGDSLYAVPDIDGASRSGSLMSLYTSESEPPFYFYWSPDSRLVSFLTNNIVGLALHVTEASAEGQSHLVAVGQPFYWDWTPSGDELLIHAGFSGNGARLEMVDPLTGNSGEKVGDPGFFQAPGISSSGRFRAFAEVGERGDSRLAIGDTAGNVELSEPHRGQVALGWSPTADLLAYISPTSDSPGFFGPLRLVDAESGETRTLSQDTVVAYFWSPDGSMIAYFSLHGRDLGGVQAAAQPSKSRQLGKMQTREVILDLWVVDTASANRKLVATFNPPDIFVNSFLPFFDQYALSHRLWSPAGDALVLPMSEEGESRIFVVPISGDAPISLSRGEIGFWSQQ
jgi:TolB protein